MAWRGNASAVGLRNAANFSNPVGAAVRNFYAVAVGLCRGDDCVPMLSDVVPDANGVQIAGT